jgi:hypothetical protein
MLSQNNFEVKSKVVIGFMDFSAAGCKVLMGHENKCDLNTLSFENLELKSLCAEGAITVFNHADVSFVSINAN